MTVSEKIGGIPVLSWVYDFGPIPAAIIMFLGDFGMICFLMLLEGKPHWQRTHYKTFLWNDTIWIPLFMAAATIILEQGPAHSGWYTSHGWHLLLLIAGFAASLYLEKGALESGQYTWAQEISPSKLWHTFIFGVVTYWLTSVLVSFMVVVLSVHVPVWAVLLAGVGIGGFAYNSWLDGKLRWPGDAHLEWVSPPRWEFRERVYEDPTKVR